MTFGTALPARAAVRYLVACLLALSAMEAAAAVIGGTSSTVTNVSAYSNYGGGDVIFKTSAPPAACEDGFWLRPTDPGFATLSALLMTAYAARLPVIVYGHDDQLWSGSTGSKFCRVYAIN